MSEAKHNPSPWAYENVELAREQSAYGVVKDADGKVLFDSLNSDVAEIHEDEGYRWDETGKRHLTLAAAAPDLLAACELWDKGFADGEEFTPEQLLKWLNDNRRVARAAIAKAKGVTE